MPRADKGFLNGLLLGMTLSLVTVPGLYYLLNAPDLVAFVGRELPRVQALYAWCARNLGLSLLPFAITLGLYIQTLRGLRRQLDAHAPLEVVSQLEHLNDVWISLFFGIGVIWTAIGMRSALLFALGDPDSAAQAGAFAVLDRLVEGGILTALTTTIVGGVGGYLMRVVKSSLLGTRLNRYYELQDQQHGSRIEALLAGIHTSVEGIGTCVAGTGRGAS